MVETCRMVLIPFLAGLLFGPDGRGWYRGIKCLNPLFGGSAFRTPASPTSLKAAVLIPFLAGLLFGLDGSRFVHGCRS